MPSLCSSAVVSYKSHMEGFRLVRGNNGRPRPLKWEPPGGCKPNQLEEMYNKSCYIVEKKTISGGGSGKGYFVQSLSRVDRSAQYLIVR